MPFNFQQTFLKHPNTGWPEKMSRTLRNYNGRHTTPKQLKIFFDTTRPSSLAHMNGHRIRQIWIR